MTLNDSATIVAFVRGRISYLSPPLGELGSRKKVKVPDMAFPKMIQPHKPDCTHSKRWEGDLRRGYVLKAVLPLTSGNSKFSSSRSPTYRFPHEEESFWEKKIRLLRKRKFRADGSEEYFEQVLQYASDAAIVSGVDCCRLGVDEFGLMFFSPLESKLGDFVC